MHIKRLGIVVSILKVKYTLMLCESFYLIVAQILSHQHGLITLLSSIQQTVVHYQPTAKAKLYLTNNIIGN